MSVLEFIYCEVMQRDIVLTTLMGEVLLEGEGGLISSCKTKILEAIPSSIAGLNTFRSLDTPCSDFEQKLIDMVRYESNVYINGATVIEQLYSIECNNDKWTRIESRRIMPHRYYIGMVII